MKQFILFTLFTVGLSMLVNAQTPDTTQRAPKFSPAQRAARQLKMMEKQLHLTEDQVLQMQVILINETVAMDSLRNNPSGDRRSTGRTRRGILQEADSKIAALLTDEQKPLYQQWKEQQRQRMMERRKGAQSTQAADAEQEPA